jgi:hypothetical protein
MTTLSPKIAVYWDFENLHASLYEQYTNEEYKPYQVQRERVLNVSALMDYIYSLGDVVINRAYNDWQSYRVYKSELLLHAIDLVQLYPKGAHAKNGADIRLAMDALEDAYHNGHITHVVIIGGDSDYIAVAQKLKKLGRFVVGIGVQGATNPFWTRSCNEFKYYETLTRTAQQEQAQIEFVTELASPASKSNDDFTAARELLVRAIQRLMAEDDVDAVLKAKVRPMMTRLNPGFDPANYNFQTFNAFLGACSDIIRSFKGEYDIMIALRQDVNQSEATSMPSIPQNSDTIMASQNMLPIAERVKNNAAIEHFLWCVQVNYISATIPITLSDIGSTMKLLASDFKIQSCGYPKNNGLKVLAEDVASLGLIEFVYDSMENIHYIKPQEFLFRHMDTLLAPQNLRDVRCIRAMSKLYLLIRLDEIRLVFDQALRLIDTALLQNVLVTADGLINDVVDICSGLGMHQKRANQILSHLMQIGLYADNEGNPIVGPGASIIAEVMRPDNLVEFYLGFVKHQLYEVIGEEYDLLYLQGILDSIPPPRRI